MKAQSRIVLALAGLCLFFEGCETASGVAASGKTARRTIELSDFDGVEVSHAFQADIRQDKAFRVEVEADEAAMPYLDVRVSGGKLVLAMKSGVTFRNIDARATVTMPELKRLGASGASRVKLDGFRAEANVNMEASGASRIDGDIDTGNLDLEASGASHITLEGHGGKLRAVASGASQVMLGKFRAGDVTAVASGASSVNVNTKGRLDAAASGASHVYYTGDPIKGSINSSGASSISEAN